MNRFKKVLALTTTFFSLAGVLAPVAVLAGGEGARGSNNLICNIFPFINGVSAFGINKLCQPGASDSGSTAVNAVSDLLRFGVSLIFIGIIIISIYVVIRAAIKYIRSEGDPGKIEEAQKAIKSVFVGIAALFIGIIGIIIVLFFFQASGAVNNEDPENIDVLNNVIDAAN